MRNNKGRITFARPMTLPLLLLLFLSFFSSFSSSKPITTIAQQITEAGSAAAATGTTSTPQSAITGVSTSPITFTLKMEDQVEGAEVGGRGPPTSSSVPSSNLLTRSIGIDVNIVRGNEPAISLPINVTIPASVNNLELCASAIEVGTPAAEMCQPVLRTIDLTQNTAAATTDTTASGTTTSSSPFSSPSSSPSSSAPTMTAPTTSFPPTATGGGNSLIGSGSIEDTKAIMIPITVIAPITAEIQNARLCAQLPSGTQTCNQIILNPQQTAYTPASVDMTTSPAPTVTSSQVTDTTTGTSTGTTDTGGGAATSSSSSRTTTITTTPGTTSTPPTTTTTPPTSTNNNTTNTTGGATSSLPAPGGRDTTSPTLTIPNDMTLQTNGTTALLVYSVKAQDDSDGTATLDEDNQLIQGDNVGGDIRISCRPSSQYFLPLGNHIVECRADDAANNTSNYSFIVTVSGPTSSAGTTDTIAPSLSVPVRVGFGTPSPSGQVRAYYEVTATDNIDGTALLDYTGLVRQSDNVGGRVLISCYPPSNTSFRLGNHTVTCSAVDEAGNRGTASFVVSVPTPPPQDMIPPTLTVPNDMVLQTGGGRPTALLVYSVTAEDNVDGTARLDEDNALIQDNVGGSIRISCNPSSQYFLQVGNHTVTCTALDASNVKERASFTVTVRGPASSTGTQPLQAEIPLTDGENTTATTTIEEEQPSTPLATEEAPLEEEEEPPPSDETEEVE